MVMVRALPMCHGHCLVIQKLSVRGSCNFPQCLGKNSVNQSKICLYQSCLVRSDFGDGVRSLLAGNILDDAVGRLNRRR